MNLRFLLNTELHLIRLQAISTILATTLIYYQTITTEQIEDEDNEDRIKEIIEERLFEALSYWPVYFEPLAFNKQVALECDLIPFIFGDIKLLSLGGCGMNLSPKLDAYQVLVCGMIDKRSTYFHKREKAYFEYVVGKDLYQRIGQILAKSAL
jgi:hypothetical protein